MANSISFKTAQSRYDNASPDEGVECSSCCSILSTQEIQDEDCNECNALQMKSEIIEKLQEMKNAWEDLEKISASYRDKIEGTIAEELDEGGGICETLALAIELTEKEDTQKLIGGEY